MPITSRLTASTLLCPQGPCTYRALHQHITGDETFILVRVPAWCSICNNSPQPPLSNHLVLCGCGPPTAPRCQVVAAWGRRGPALPSPHNTVPFYQWFSRTDLGHTWCCTVCNMSPFPTALAHP